MVMGEVNSGGMCRTTLFRRTGAHA